MVPQQLTNLVVKQLLGVAFKKAPRDVRGNIVLKRAKIVRFFPSVGFIIAMIALALTYFVDPGDPQEQAEILSYLHPIAALLGVFTLWFLVSKTLITKNGIVSYRLTGKKQLDFESIYSIEYTPIFSGCAVLHGDERKILIPLDTTGFSECLEILKDKLGPEKCTEITNELQKRSHHLNSL